MNIRPRDPRLDPRKARTACRLTSQAINDDDQPVCLYCGRALKKSSLSNFCRLQHAAQFAEAIIGLGFPKPHKPTPWCSTSGACVHLPLQGSVAP